MDQVLSLALPKFIFFSGILIILGMFLMLFLSWVTEREQPPKLNLYVFWAILSAMKLDQQVPERLSGEQKKKIADSTYEYLPDQVRDLLGRDLYEELIEQGYQQFLEFYRENFPSEES